MNHHESFKKELLGISKLTQLGMGQDCQVHYDFGNDITLTPSGKYRYNISNVYQFHDQ